MSKKSLLDTLKVMSDPKYRGRHLVMIAGKVFAAKSAKEAARIFNKVTKKYSRQIPTITYIPKADTLILWIS
jgi:hypothetical protein